MRFIKLSMGLLEIYYFTVLCYLFKIKLDKFILNVTLVLFFISFRFSIYLVFLEVLVSFSYKFTFRYIVESFIFLEVNFL